jgi:hypothetical protein
MINQIQQSPGVDGNTDLTSETQDGLQSHIIIGKKETDSKF